MEASGYIYMYNSMILVTLWRPVARYDLYNSMVLEVETTVGQRASWDVGKLDIASNSL